MATAAAARSSGLLVLAGTLFRNGQIRCHDEPGVGRRHDHGDTASAPSAVSHCVR